MLFVSLSGAGGFELFFDSGVLSSFLICFSNHCHYKTLRNVSLLFNCLL